MNGHDDRSDEDAERDAWLRSALRHAPDAGVGPPAALSRAILDEARAKARDGAPHAAPRTPTRRWWQWRWLGGRVPAAIGGLMVTVLAVALWRGGLEDMPHGTQDGATQRPADSQGAPVVAPERTEPSATAEPPPVTAPQPPATARPPAVAQRPAAASPGRGRASSVARSAGPPAADAPARQAAVPAPAAARREATEDPAPAAAKSAAAPSTESAPPQVALPALQRPAEAPAAAPLADRFADPRSKLAAPAAAAPRRAARPSAEPPLAALQQELRDGPGRWTWQADAGPQRPVGDAMAAWLSRLDAATASRWAEAGTPAFEPPALSVQWLRDGQPRYQLRLSATGAVWEALGEDSAPRRAWSAPLDAAASAALRGALE